MGFRPRTEITSLFTSLMGRLTASLSGRLTAFLPQIFKAGGSRHGDGGSHGGEICWESRMLPPCSRVSWRSSPRFSKLVGVMATGVSRWRDLLGKSDVTSGRPSRDASRRSFLQITKPMGFVIATGVLTVARFVGKVGCYLLVASLSGRLRASLSGRLTAFHPPNHKAGGSRHRDGGVLTVARFVGKVGSYLLVASLSGRLRASLSGRLTAFLPPDHKADGLRHCDGGTHGGEICWESRMLPLGCESLGTPQGVPLGTLHGVPSPRSRHRGGPSS